MLLRTRVTEMRMYNDTFCSYIFITLIFISILLSNFLAEKERHFDDMRLIVET